MGRLTKLELVFAEQLSYAGFTNYESEYRFHPTRRWRFDFAWPDLLIAVEIEGGTFSRTGSRHTSGIGFHKDCIKYGEALILGWGVLRLDVKLVKSGEGLQMLERFIEYKREW